MNRLDHWIITPFNVSLYDWTAQKAAQTKCATHDAWMTHRVPLFWETAAKSIASQTCQDFRWLLLFDHRTPMGVMDNIRSHIDSRTEIMFFAGTMHQWENKPEAAANFARIRQHIKERVRLGTTHVISTMLDNDDALHVEHVSLVQQAAIEFAGDRQLLILPISTHYRTSDGRAMDVELVRHNVFYSLVERIGIEPDIIYRYPHWSVPNYYPCRTINEKRPMGIQIVHKHNCMNVFVDKWPNAKYHPTNLSQFGIDIERLRAVA